MIKKFFYIVGVVMCFIKLDVVDLNIVFYCQSVYVMFFDFVVEVVKMFIIYGNLKRKIQYEIGCFRSFMLYYNVYF